MLDFLVSRASKGFLPPGRLTGLRLVATDQDWSSGEGEEIRGTSEALGLGIAGRPVVLDELDGPGTGILAERLEPAQAR